MQSKSDSITNAHLTNMNNRTECESAKPGHDSSSPWYCYAIILGSLSIIIGILWDISWHRSIGRDTFWTPAHIAIHIGGIVGGVVSGYLILRSSFIKSSNEYRTSIPIGPLRAPTGAWVCLFGNMAMLASAPFDDWWHNAYGIDVKILSPPHMVLALGMFCVVFGGLLLLAKDWNNSNSETGIGLKRSPWLMVMGGGILLAMAGTVLIELSWPNQYRSKTFFIVSCATYPFYLLGIAKATKWRWAGTAIGGIYMFLICLSVWILPLFKAQPMLAPINNPVDHFVPLPFPLLLIIPGLALDLIRFSLEKANPFLSNVIIILLAPLFFTVTFFYTQYHFGSFLLSESAQNWFFATHKHWGYQETLGPWSYRFWNTAVEDLGQHQYLFYYAFGSCLLAILAGLWMGRIRR